MDREVRALFVEWGGSVFCAVGLSDRWNPPGCRRVTRLLQNLLYPARLSHSPPYALLLAIALLVERSFAWLPPYFFFLQNFWTAAKGSFGIPLLGATWSLAVEEQFYLSLPLLIRYTPRRVLEAVLGLVVLCARYFAP
jgi:hypothetical protein